MYGILDQFVREVRQRQPTLLTDVVNRLVLMYGPDYNQ